MPRTLLFLLLLSAALSAATTCFQTPELSDGPSLQAATTSLPQPTTPVAQRDTLAYSSLGTEVVSHD